MEKVSNEATKKELKAEVIEEKEENLSVQVKKNDSKVLENNEEISTEEGKIKSKTFEESKIKYKNNQKKKKIIRIWVFVVIAIMLVIAFFSTIFALLNINNSTIISGVKADSIDLKGLNIEEAKQLLNKKIEQKINEEIKIKIDKEEQSLILSQIELEYDIDTAIEEAYNVGRRSNIFVNNFDIVKAKLFGNDIRINEKYNEELLENIIRDIKSKIPDCVKEVDFCIEDEKLIITPGKAGLTINEDELKHKIQNVIYLNNSNIIEINTFKVEPKNIDIEKIYEEVHTEAKDAYYTKNPFQVFPEVLGVDFNIDEAREILKEDKEEYIIPLTITKPNKTVNNIGTEAFPDMLSTFSTRYDASNVPRTTNLKIAVSKLNGVVVMPGETFSYNKTLGKRTSEAGYKDAAGYAGGKVVPMTGGGICQISSTLYDAVVLANLEIVERHNHAFTTSYIGAGKDATVVYGALDFKFKNTRNFPVTIKASAQNGIAKIDIYGIKEDTEYEIDISTTILNYIPYSVIYENDSSLDEGYEKVTQYGNQGCKSITYKIYKLNGAEVSRTVLSTDTYDAMNKYITRGTRKTVPVVVEPTTPSEPEPTPEPTPTPTPDPEPETETPVTLPEEPDDPIPEENEPEINKPAA